MMITNGRSPADLFDDLVTPSGLVVVVVVAERDHEAVHEKQDN